MKIFISFAFMLAISSASSTDDCSKWPAGLPTLEECCNFPTIFHFSTLYDCTNECRSLSKQQSSLCVAECYVRKSGIIANGAINKSAVLHEANLDIGVNPWAEIINTSLDKCKDVMEVHKSVESQLTALLACIRKEASKNCMEFKAMLACTKAEKFYEDCKRPTDACDIWPKRLTNSTIVSCCNKPKLVSEETNDKCKINCTFAIDNYKCVSKCLYEQVGVFGDDNMLNVTALKAAFDENHDERIEWSDVIDKSVDECQRIYKEKYGISVISDPSQLTGLEYCIEWQMSARCIDFNDVGYGSGCYGFKKFKKQCAEVLPDGPF